MLDINTIYNALALGEATHKTDVGVSIRTHCLYPSFDPVEVFVVGYGDGAIVHDYGGASKSAWTHGRSNPDLNKSAKMFGCSVKKGQILQQIGSLDWLWAAVASVANASSNAANSAVDKPVLEKEEPLIAKTKTILE